MYPKHALMSSAYCYNLQAATEEETKKKLKTKKHP